MIWKQFWGKYRISEAGEVESSTSGDWKPLKKKKSKSDKHGGFYLTVSLHEAPGGHKKLHHLVWECFMGPRRKGYVINHIDGDRTNCALWNLEEITQKANIANVIARNKFKLFGKPYDRNTSGPTGTDSGQESPGLCREVGSGAADTALGA